MFSFQHQERGGQKPCIPEQLMMADRWVCRDREKIPYNPRSGARAKTTNPRTWGSYDQAVLRMQRARAGAFAGVGFVFGDGFAGVDIDHCRDTSSGEIADWALEIVQALDSYTEISPSGAGLHILVLGSVPSDGKKTAWRDGAVEMYDRDRYFTITGNHLPFTPATLEERTQALAELHRQIFARPKKQPQKEQRAAAGDAIADDGELIVRACNARDGREFTALWNGDTSAHDCDDSKADFHLCIKLAFWTGKDQERIDRLFRQSGLMREKWDKRRGGSTYGADTIEKAIGATRECYTPRTAPTEIKFDFRAPDIREQPAAADEDAHEACRRRIAELEAEVERLKGVIVRMGEHDRERRDIAAAKMKPATKLVVQDAVSHLDRDNNRWMDYPVQEAAARRLNMTPATVRKHLHLAAEQGVFEIAVRPTGRDKEQVTAIRPGPVILENRRLKDLETSESKAGGKREGAGRKPGKPGVCGACESHDVQTNAITKKTARIIMEYTTIDQTCRSCGTREIVEGGSREISSEVVSEIKFDSPEDAATNQNCSPTVLSSDPSNLILLEENPPIWPPRPRPCGFVGAPQARQEAG